MGVVWLAHDEFLDREVAVKEIRPGGRELRAEDPEVRRALREARAAAKLSKHPGIITVHDVVTDGRGLPWIVMELLAGRSLSETLESDGPMSVDRAARVGAQVLSALDYAHNNGVLHRDIKSGNVMLVDDQAVLTDFGIAVIDGDSVLTATGQLPGVPEYISPERIRGEEALPAADLWSVGIMLYGMVVGRTPFHRGDVQATLGAVLSVEPDPDPKVGRLAPVIDGLLRKRPAERMTARNAIEKLTEITALPSAAPLGMRVRLEFPTRSDNPAGDLTVADETVPSTRTEAPPFMPRSHTPVPVAPDAPTLDPRPYPRRQPARPPRSARGPLIVAAAVIVVAAVVLTVILTNQSSEGQGSAAKPSSTPRATPMIESDVPLEKQSERLGFEIDVPVGWARSSSIDGPVSSVVWTSEPTDSWVGPLTVVVRRDTDKPGVSARDFLDDEGASQRARQGTMDYEQSGPDGNDTSADLVYTFNRGGYHYHTQTRAITSGAVYQLTFSLYASDAKTLDEQWAAAEPLIKKIRGSFLLS
ncbi:hypothetical protein GCM10027436_52260 [Actinophytocola sediminis]